jgi:hypothetical protein
MSILGRAFERTLYELYGLRGPLLLHAQQAEKVQGIRVVRVGREQFEIAGFRLAEAALLVRRHGSHQPWIDCWGG